MDKNKTRNKFNKFLLFWYVALILILPMISLIAAFYIYKDLWTSDDFWTGASFFMYFFINMPVYIIYTRLVIKEYFPKSNLQGAYLFIPLLISYGTFFIDKGFEGFWTFVITNSLPLYIGLNLVFLIGLIYLVYTHDLGNKLKEVTGKIIGIIIISFLIFYAPAYFTTLGVEIQTIGYAGYELVRNLIGFIFIILLMAALHFKVVIRVYNKGML